METPLPTVIPCWATVNLLGHQERHGYCDIVQVCGAEMIRVVEPAVPGQEGFKDEHDYWNHGLFDLACSTVIVPRQSIHSIDITTEGAVMQERMKCRRTNYDDSPAGAASF